MYVYFNNGLSFLTVESDYVVKVGEVLFSAIATPSQLQLAFSGYTSALSRNAILQQIYALDAQKTPRRFTDAFLGTDGGFLKNIETQIAALRAQL